jgi:hypothetical protein
LIDRQTAAKPFKEQSGNGNPKRNDKNANDKSRRDTDRHFPVGQESSKFLNVEFGMQSANAITILNHTENKRRWRPEILSAPGFS